MASLGQLLLETARGTQKDRQLDEKEVAELRLNMANRIADTIDELRAIQRRAIEDSNNIVLL